MDELRIPPVYLGQLGIKTRWLLQGSMDIYVFNRQVLIDALMTDEDDSASTSSDPHAKHKVLPISLEYREDIGTVQAFFEMAWL